MARDSRSRSRESRSRDRRRRSRSRDSHQKPKSKSRPSRSADRTKSSRSPKRDAEKASRSADRPKSRDASSKDGKKDDDKRDRSRDRTGRSKRSSSRGGRGERRRRSRSRSYDRRRRSRSADRRRGSYRDRRDERRRSRSRDRKSKRSRSPERKRRSRSPERKRAAEIRRKQQEFVRKGRDKIMGPGALQIGGITDANKPKTNLIWDGVQWVSRANAELMETSENKMKRVSFLNVPHHILALTEESFIHSMIDQFRTFDCLADPTANPFKHVVFFREKPGGHVLAELNSEEDATKVIEQANFTLLGVAVQAQRPENATSRILKISEALIFDGEQDDDDFEDVKDDMQEVSSKYGQVKSIIVLKPEHKDKLSGTMKIGDCFLEFATAGDAQHVLTSIGHRRYDDRPLNIKHFDDEEWTKSVEVLFK